MMKSYLKHCNPAHAMAAVISASALFLLLLALLLPQAAYAQATFAPPPPAPGPGLGCVQPPPSVWLVGPDDALKQMSSGWLPKAQGIAESLLKALFVFEIFMLGLQAALFHQDLQQLLSGLTFKTFLMSFFIYLISNAGTLFPAILSSFQIAGQRIGTGNNIFDIFVQGSNAAMYFFCAAMSSHEGDLQGEAIQVDPLTICGKFNVGSGNMACSIGAGIGHLSFEFYIQFLGLLIIASMGIIFLSFTLLMSEAYIVMFAGVIFLGFSALRFTMPFTRGYFSYMSNVIAKLFTFWIVMAIEQVMLMPILQGTGQDLIKSGAVKFGLGAEMLLVPASVAVAQIMAFSALAWFLPKTMGRFVSGRSAFAALGNINQSFTAVTQAATLSSAARRSGPASTSQPSEGVHPQTPSPLLMPPSAVAPADTPEPISPPGFTEELMRPSAENKVRSGAVDFNNILSSSAGAAQAPELRRKGSL